MKKKKLKICSFYTPDYVPYLKTFLQTYKGKGDLWLQPVEASARETATFSKPWQFKKCVNEVETVLYDYTNWDEHQYEYYIFSDIDLLFHPNFCFTELCKQDSLGVIIRDQFSYPQRNVNASIITVHHSLYNSFIEDWTKLIEDLEIDGISIFDEAPTKINNHYYWDQVSLNHVYKKYKFHNIDQNIYLSQELKEDTRILSPHAYNPERKQKMYNELLNEMYNNWK